MGVRDLVRNRAVCTTWKSMIENDQTLWRQLDVTSFSDQLSSILYSIAQNHLTRLKVRSIQLWKYLPYLKELIIRTEILPIPLECNFPTLEVLDLRGLTYTNNLKVFLEQRDLSKHLKTLKLGWISESHAETVHPYLLGAISEETYPKLSHLVANGYRRIELVSLRGLVVLNLSCCSVTGGCWEVIERNWESLEELNLRAVPDFAQREEVILLCKGLKKINLSCTNLPLEFYIKLIETCKQLVELDICYIAERHQPKAKELYYSILKNLAPQLTMIGLGGFPLYDEDCTMLLRAMPKLDYIGFGGIPVTGATLVQIIEFCPYATKLNLHNTLLHKIHFERLMKDCKFLKEIDCSLCKYLPADLSKNHILKPSSSTFSLD
eukprot:TRINITY_DN5174_c0_g1_i1.p1 TRINITY_DN5174_c0_g1~~TRINITY_DN5174_c0_g1_i1.p1  ORF type:complete len:395 (-),score=75.29 TRINITY_DN5174_c0_g1_i1:11-1147(-)